MNLSRRQFATSPAAGFAALPTSSRVIADDNHGESEANFQLNYILGSPMYGTTRLADVIAEAPKTGAKVMDVWPRSHANHREQLDELGYDRVEALLEQHGVKLGMITRYDLGPFHLASEFPILQRFGGKLIVCGAKTVGGDSLKRQVSKFVEQLKPHVEHAAKFEIKIGIENHAGSIVSSPESIRYFAEAIDAQSLSPNLGLAMAPYHLPQNPKLIAELIEMLGNQRLAFFQAWQHGKGCMKKLPKAEELLQMPGRGPLDFQPILSALRKIKYAGWTEIFMHPVPRGIPILDSTAKVTSEINRSRAYLEKCIADH